MKFSYFRLAQDQTNRQLKIGGEKKAKEKNCQKIDFA